MVSQRGFAVTTKQIRVVAGELKRQLCKPFKQGLPSRDLVRRFRIVHRDYAFRKFERLELAKHDARLPDHVKAHETVLKKVQNNYQEILKDAKCVLNMDETAVTVADIQMEKGRTS